MQDQWTEEDKSEVAAQLMTLARQWGPLGCLFQHAFQKYVTWPGPPPFLCPHQPSEESYHSWQVNCDSH
jgi:hypothetical protein